MGNVLIEVDATVGEFAEGSLLLELCGERTRLVWPLQYTVAYRYRLTTMSSVIEV